MAGILDILNSDTGKTLISGASKQFRQDEGKTTIALSTALPLILGAMKNNASTPEGASGLLSALGNDKHSGGILDNLGSILGGGEVDQDVLDDGVGILGHIFGGKEQKVANEVSKSSGIDMDNAMNILKVAGPLVMGALGKETRQKDISDQNGIGDLLGGMLIGASNDQQSLITKLLDADGDGSIIDDVAGMILSGDKKKGGLGGMLGGLFGK